jgi:phosphatidylglycerophosphate synthase
VLLESLVNSNNKKKIPHYNIKLKIKQNIPNTITLLRLIALPHLIYSFNNLSMFVTFSLFLASITTDLIDGYVARKLSSTSKFGAYLDVIVDFIFITGMYLIFSFKEIYSPWLLLVIVFVFTQFVVSNIILKQTIYDPVGKYFGSILFGGIGVTILISEQLISNLAVFSDQLVYIMVTAFIVISALVSLLSRFIYLLRQRT